MDSHFRQWLTFEKKKIGIAYLVGKDGVSTSISWSQIAQMALGKDGIGPALVLMPTLPETSISP